MSKREKQPQKQCRPTRACTGMCFVARHIRVRFMRACALVKRASSLCTRIVQACGLVFYFRIAARARAFHLDAVESTGEHVDNQYGADEQADLRIVSHQLCTQLFSPPPCLSAHSLILRSLAPFQSVFGLLSPLLPHLQLKLFALFSFSVSLFLRQLSPHPPSPLRLYSCRCIAWYHCSPPPRHTHCADHLCIIFADHPEEGRAEEQHRVVLNHPFVCVFITFFVFSVRFVARKTF